MVTINKLSALDTVNAADQFVIYSESNGDARRATATAVKDFINDLITTDDAVTFEDGVNIASGDIVWRTGTGSPEGSITAAVGSLWLRSDGGSGTTLWVKETGTGNTGWVAK